MASKETLSVAVTEEYDGKIVVFVDLDGTVFYGPPPLVSMLLQRFVPAGRHTPPKQASIPDLHTGEQITTKMTRWLHSRRGVRKDAVVALEMFGAIQKDRERNNLAPVVLSVLSGRQPYLHEMTREQLSATGLAPLFSFYHLNRGEAPASWKQSIAYLEAHKPEVERVYHLEDDPIAAVAVAQAGTREKKVKVFLLQSIATKALMLRLAGIVLPPEVVVVASLQDAAAHIYSELHHSDM